MLPASRKLSPFIKTTQPITSQSTEVRAVLGTHPSTLSPALFLSQPLPGLLLLKWGSTESLRASVWPSSGTAPRRSKPSRIWWIKSRRWWELIVVSLWKTLTSCLSVRISLIFHCFLKRERVLLLCEPTPSRFGSQHSEHRQHLLLALTLGSTAGKVMHPGCASMIGVFSQLLLLHTSMRGEGGGTGVSSCVCTFVKLYHLPLSSQRLTGSPVLT